MIQRLSGIRLPKNVSVGNQRRGALESVKRERAFSCAKIGGAPPAAANILALPPACSGSALVLMSDMRARIAASGEAGGRPGTLT